MDKEKKKKRNKKHKPTNEINNNERPLFFCAE